MALVHFSEACPGLAGSVTRLYGHEATLQLTADYQLAVGGGGNDDLGVVREEGVSFHPRIGRVVSLVIQECASPEVRVLRVAMYSTLPDTAASSGLIPSELAVDVQAVRRAAEDARPWVQGIALALQLDRIRHIHMTDESIDERSEFLAAVGNSPLLGSKSVAPENLRRKVLHALNLQLRRIDSDGKG